MYRLQDGTVVSEGFDKNAVASVVTAMLEVPGFLESINSLLYEQSGTNVVLFWPDGDTAQLPRTNIEFVRAIPVGGVAAVGGLGKGRPVPDTGVSSQPAVAGSQGRLVDDVRWGVEGDDGLIPIPRDYVIVEDKTEPDEDGDPERVVVFGPADNGNGERLLPIRDRNLAKIKRVER